MLPRLRLSASAWGIRSSRVVVRGVLCWCCDKGLVGFARVLSRGVEIICLVSVSRNSPGRDHVTSGHDTTRKIQSDSRLKPVEPQGDRLLVAGCCVLVVCGHSTDEYGGGATDRKAVAANLDDGGVPTGRGRVRQRLRGTEHGCAESFLSHRAGNTAALSVTTSTEELAATTSRTASLFRLRSAHGRVG